MCRCQQVAQIDSHVQAFIHTRLCAFSPQQVCNRLIRSQLKDPRSRAWASVEGNYYHNPLTTTQTKEAGREVKVKAAVTVLHYIWSWCDWSVGEIFPISADKSDIQRQKTWEIHQSKPFEVWQVMGFPQVHTTGKPVRLCISAAHQSHTTKIQAGLYKQSIYHICIQNRLVSTEPAPEWFKGKCIL